MSVIRHGCNSQPGQPLLVLCSRVLSNRPPRRPRCPAVPPGHLTPCSVAPLWQVGILRRGRFVKGKQVGKGVMVQPGDQVKKGQTLAFIEQLGTHWPVEAPQVREWPARRLPALLRPSPSHAASARVQGLGGLFCD